MPPRISLSLIVKNEEANLAGCLQSAAGLVDEIIVVDTGSTDCTREVATSLGARVFDFPWCDSFSAARNESLRHATGDWIFWLDGDERLDEANRARFQALRAGLNGAPIAFVMKQCSAPGTPAAAATEVDQVRLFRHDPAVRWSYRVHEQILPALRRAGHAVRFTDIAITHTGYQDPDLQRKKTERNLRLLHLEYREQPEDPFTLFNLGWALQELGQLDRAVPLLRRSLERCGPGDSIVRKLYVLLSHAHRRLGRPREALAVCRAGRARCPDDPELRFVEGVLLLELGDPAGAEGCLRRLLALRPGAHFASLDAGLRGGKARHHLALACRAQGQLAEAEAHWRAVRAEQPEHLGALLGLAELFLEQRRDGELDELLAELAARPEGALETTVLWARRHLARREFAEARRLLEEATDQHSGAVWPWLVLSQVYLQAGDDPAAAERVLRKVLELDPSQAEARNNLAILLARQGGEAAAAPPHPSLALRAGASPAPSPLGGEGRGEGEDPAPDIPILHLAPRPCLRLAFACFNRLPYHLDTPHRLPLGGSESALCYLAEALAQAGHEVFLFHPCPAPARSRGVQCLPLPPAGLPAVPGLDVLIVLNLAGRAGDFRRLLPPATGLVLWTGHALDQPAVLPLRDSAERDAYDGFAFVSDWQRRQYVHYFGLDPEKTTVLRNGIGPAFANLFGAGEAILAAKARPPVLAYTSTPYRGLDLLLEAFPRIRRAVPGVVLHVFSGLGVYQVPAAEDQARFGWLYGRCRGTEGVTYLGSRPQPELAAALRAAAVLAYPNSYPETSCISVLEGMAAGCRVVTSRRAALPETAAGFARLVPPDDDRPAYVDGFVTATVETLTELTGPEAAVVEEQLAGQVAHVHQHHTWPVLAGQWVHWLSPLRARRR